MAETWEETKARLKKQGINLQTDIVVIEPPKPPTARREERKPEPPVKLYNIHKRSLPIGNPPLDKIVVFGVTKLEAEWWVEYKLKTKCYEYGPDDSKTLIYFDIIPDGATPKERSIYFNAPPLTTEPVLGYAPRRIN